MSIAELASFLWIPLGRVPIRNLNNKMASPVVARRPLLIMRSDVAYGPYSLDHAEPVKAVLAGERILHQNSLATVTTNFIVVRRPEKRAEAIIGLSRVSCIKRIETTHPGLLVIAAAVYLLAAACAYSPKQGGQLSIPLAVLATLFVAAYFLTRRAAVAFVVDREATETMHGSLREASALVKAMERAQQELTAFAS
jgi:hypothetical protein